MSAGPPKTSTASRKSRGAGAAKIASDTLLVSLGRYSQYLVSLLVIPILARALGVDGMVLFAVATASSFFGSVLVDMGLTQILSVRAAAAEDVSQVRSNYLGARLLIVTTFAVVAAIALIVIGNPWLSMVTTGLVVGGLSSIGEDWLLISSMRYATYAALQLVSRVSYLIGVYLFLPLAPLPLTALACLGASNVVFGALTIWTTRKSARFTRISMLEMASLVKDGMKVLPSKLLSNASLQVPMLLYSAFAPVNAVGYFAASDKVSRAGQGALDAFSVAMLPRLARVRSDRAANFWPYATRSMGVAFIIGCVAALVLTVCADWAISLLYGEAFVAAIPVLRVEVWIIPAGAVTSVVVSSVLYVRRDTVGIFLTSAASLVAVLLVVFAVSLDATSLRMGIGAVAVDWTVMIVVLARVGVLHRRDAIAPSELEIAP